MANKIRGVLFILVLYSCTFFYVEPTLAAEPKVILEKNTMVAVFLNLGNIYTEVIGALKHIDAPENAALKEEIAKAWSQLPPGSPSPKELIQKVLDFDSKAIFQPNGSFLFALSENLVPRLAIEAKVKPKELFALLTENKMAPPILPTHLEDDLVSFDFPPINAKSRDLSLMIGPGGVVLSDLPDYLPTFHEDWKTFLQNTDPSACYFALEVDGRKVVNNLRKQASGAAGKGNVELRKMGDLQQIGEIAPNVRAKVSNPKNESSGSQAKGPLPDPRLESFQRARIFVNKKSIIAMIAMSDAPTKTNLKALLLQGIQMGKAKINENPAKSTSPKNLAEINKLIDNVKIIDKGPWLGLSLEGPNPVHIAMVGIAAVGVAAAIAVPNFKRAREEARRKACFANQRVLLGALEMYNMDHSDMVKSISEKDIQEGGFLVGEYLRNPIPHPESGCSYSSKGDLLKNGEITCTFHGSVK